MIDTPLPKINRKNQGQGFSNGVTGASRALPTLPPTPQFFWGFAHVKIFSTVGYRRLEYFAGLSGGFLNVGHVVACSSPAGSPQQV